MIKLDEGNVLLKPSQRRQLMGWLKRSLRLGERLGDFVLTIRLHRCGRQVEAKATVHDSAGDFGIRARHGDFISVLRDLVRQLVTKLHSQFVQRTAPILG